MTDLKQLTNQYNKEHEERINKLKELILENAVDRNFISFISGLETSASGIYEKLLTIIDKELYKAEVGKPLPHGKGGWGIVVETLDINEGVNEYATLRITVDSNNVVKDIEYKCQWVGLTF